MKSSKKINDVHVRFTDAEFDLIVEESKRRNLSMPQTAKILLLEILCGFDQKQEAFMRRFDKQDEQLALLLQISTIGAAAGALPPDFANQDKEVIAKKMKMHFQASRQLGDSLVSLVKKGSI